MAWARVRYLSWRRLLAVVTVALVASCSTADDTAIASSDSMTFPTASAMIAADSTTNPATTRAPVVGSPSATLPAPSSSSQPMTKVRGSLLYPGGDTGLDMLNHRGLVTADGQLRFRDSARAADNNDSGLASATACSYVFGLPGQVAGTALLPTSLTLADDSGYFRSPDRTILACIYQVTSDQDEGTPVLALQITDGPPLDPEAPGAPIIVSGIGFQASLSYSPTYDGTRISEADANEWLGQALSLLATT